MPPRLIRQYRETDDVALHDIAAQACAALTAALRRSADLEGSTDAMSRFEAERRGLAESLRSLRVGDRRGTIRMIERWSGEAERLAETVMTERRSVG